MFAPYTPNSSNINGYDPGSVGLLFAQCPKESCLAYNELIEASRGQHTRSKSSLSNSSESSLSSSTSSSSSTSHRRNKSNISQPYPYQGHLKPAPTSNTWQPPSEWQCSQESLLPAVAKDDAKQKSSSLSKILHAAVAKR